MKKKFYDIAQTLGVHIVKYESSKSSFIGWDVDIKLACDGIYNQFYDCWIGGDEHSQNIALKAFTKHCEFISKQDATERTDSIARKIQADENKIN